MTDYVRSGSPTGPIVRRNGWSPDAPPQSNIAAVLVYRNRYMRVVWPDEAPPQLPRPAETYEVDISPHHLTLSVVLPTRDRREFLAEIDVEWRVVDPVALVRRWVSDVRRIVSWPLEERAWYISTSFRVDEIAEAEDLINQRLREVGWPGWRRQGGPPLTNADYLGAADGLWTRAQVRLTVPQRASTIRRQPGKCQTAKSQDRAAQWALTHQGRTGISRRGAGLAWRRTRRSPAVRPRPAPARRGGRLRVRGRQP